MFPEAFPGTLGVSLIGRALSQKKWQLNLVDLKQFPTQSDRIDSVPFGGGSGMVLSPITFEKAFNSLSDFQKQQKKFYLSPRGRKLTQQDMLYFSKCPGITMLCGRYEGVDQRILDFYEFEEISIGDFVLMGGEVAAMAFVEGIVRLLPEVVGNDESIRTDSFQNNLLEYHQYTKPRNFHGLDVPEVLVSGNHKKIEVYRITQSKSITKLRRPDLWDTYISSSLSDLF